MEQRTDKCSLLLIVPISDTNSPSYSDSPVTSSHDACRWYAMKVFHNQVFKIEADITSRLGFECYVPREKVMVETPQGKKTGKIRPAVAGLLFVSSTVAGLCAIKQLTLGEAMFYPASDGKPAVIPDREMTMFRLVTSASDEGLEYLSDSVQKYAVGQKVRVLEGPFAGAEGHICRIKGNRRLVVSIHGICAVATSYIPTCFLEKIP